MNIDYCVSYNDRIYSVPYTLMEKRVEIRATASIVELLHDGVRVASRRRSYGPKGTAVIATSTARARIATTASGRRSASWAGRRRWGRTRASSRGR